MDIISFNEAATANSRIEICNANPDSTSGIVTVPKVIASGETITIPAGRVAILPNVQIDGVLNVEGEVFIPSGATLGDLDAQLALKAPLENPAFTSGISTKDVKYKSTPVNITSWSYVGTTITLNAASHTFVAGDYIEVSGLTATTYPANGIHLVTSVTATTIVFSLLVTPTGTTGVSSATVKGHVTVNGRANDYISTIVDVRLNRVINTIYYNTSGKIKWIMASLSSTAVPANLKAIVNGVDVTYGGGTVRTSGDVASIIFPVPNGLSYQITGIGGTWTNLTWTETI